MGGIGDVMMVLVILAGAFVLIKSGKLEEILGGDFKLPALPALPGLPAPAPSSGGEPAETGGGPISTASGGQYPFAECQGGPSDRAQWCSKHPCLASGEETVGYLNIKPDTGDDDVSIKMRGGAHSGDCPNSGCCYIVGISFSGEPHGGLECPHPSSAGSLSMQALFNPGPIKGKTFGIMARIYPQGSADKIEVWLDMANNGQFKKFYETTSTKFFGKCNGVSGGCADRGELTFFRLDNVGGYAGATLTKAYTKPYSGGGGAAPTGTGAGLGPRTIGGAPAPAAPAAGKRTIGESNYARAYAPTRTRFSN